MTSTDLPLETVQERIRWLQSELDTLLRTRRVAVVGQALERLHDAGIHAAVVAEEDGAPRDEDEGAVYFFIRDPEPARLEAADGLLQEVDRFSGVWLLLASKYATGDENAKVFDEPHLAWSAKQRRMVLTPIFQQPVGKLDGA